METRKSILITSTAEHKFYKDVDEENAPKFTAEVIAPIVSGGDPIGVVLFGTKEKDAKMSDLELKLVETAAGFLAKQMEP